MSSRRPVVLVLFGGRSSEHSISCVSAGSILRAIDRDVYEVVAVGITREGAWVRAADDTDRMVIREGVLPEVDPDGDRVHLSLDPGAAGFWIESGGERGWQPVDVVFPVLHGPFGEDGTIQGVFEIAGLPFVGSGVFASAACMDKGRTKALLASSGIPAGRWASFAHKEWNDTRHDEVVSGLGWPMFVKPARAGSSVGVGRAVDSDGLHRAVAEAARHDPVLILESAVQQAREIECGVLVGPGGAPRASVCAEIKVREGHDFYDFEAKYLDDSVDLEVPADLDPQTDERVRSLAVEAFTALGCEGLARVDFFIDGAGEVMVNEVNTMPGFTSISMYPRMWAAAGVPYPELVDTLIQEALHRRRGLR